jgi:hypothetical protein
MLEEGILHMISLDLESVHAGVLHIETTFLVMSNGMGTFGFRRFT